MDVALVRWPSESARRTMLAAAAVPRLLLVDDGAPPPLPGDCLEDWVRVPASDDDVRVRVAALSLRAEGHVPTASIDEDGIVRYDGRAVPVPPVEARIAGALLDRFGAVVSRDALTRAAWAKEAPGRNVLDVHVLRLRRRLATVGLVIRTVRSRGYLLDAESDMRQVDVREA